MIVISLPRGTGKTSSALRLAAKTGSIFVTMSEREAVRLRESSLCKQFKMPPEDIICWHEAMERRFPLRDNPRRFIIDNADLILRNILANPVYAITTTSHL